MKLLTLGLLMTHLFASAQEPLHFVACNDPVLDGVSRPLSREEIQDPAMQHLFDAMMALAKGEQGDQKKHVLVGLAAPQIGKSLRVILVDVTADGKGGVSGPRSTSIPKSSKYPKRLRSGMKGAIPQGMSKGSSDAPAA